MKYVVTHVRCKQGDWNFGFNEPVQVEDIEGYREKLRKRGLTRICLTYEERSDE